jgi:hypothetical protein
MVVQARRPKNQPEPPRRKREPKSPTPDPLIPSLEILFRRLHLHHLEHMILLVVGHPLRKRPDLPDTKETRSDNVIFRLRISIPVPLHACYFYSSILVVCFYLQL